MRVRLHCKNSFVKVYGFSEAGQFNFKNFPIAARYMILVRPFENLVSTDNAAKIILAGRHKNG